MGTFVLVHGGWHGSWCWRDVRPLLRAAGHEVWTPTLTGLGDRAHLLEPLRQVLGLDTHVRDVAGLLEYEDLHEVVLVGHSYGGMVITAVADRCADRVARLVYLDAFVPADGESLLELLPPARRAMYEESARERGAGWLVPPPPPEAFGISDAAQARWVSERLGPQPLRSFQEGVRLAGRDVPPPSVFVHCTAGPVAPSFAPFAARLRTAEGWTYHELATGHDAMLTQPGEVAAVLLAVPGA